MDKKQKEKQKQEFKTDGGKTKSNALEVPSIALPKGGGAIKGIDQKFTVNAVNGTASFSIPLPVSPARGAVPALSLSYNSGGGNSSFGLGWNINLPSIKRKTDGELPQYQDDIDSDTYLLSEAEDLVPEFKRYTSGPNLGGFDLSSGDFEFKESDSADALWRIRYYRPRTEGLFARIERWTNKANSMIRWRVITKENIITLYGWTSASRLSDPEDPTKVFEWLPELIIDDKDNCAHYLYKTEDAIGLDSTWVHNRNRYKNNTITYTNLYPDKILYGNKTPYQYGNPFLNESDYMFQTVFDYGQYNPLAPYDKNGVWGFRQDAFSEYKPGFEIRTTRLCKRVLLFHFFNELPGGFALVKSLNLNHGNNSAAGFSFLQSATSIGYIKLNNGSYTQKSLPSVEFKYEAHQWNASVKSVSSENLINAPNGLSGVQFTDLYNEGLPGILSEQGKGWYYKRNLGKGNFEAAHLVNPKPSFTGLGRSLQLVDLNGDGNKQIVNFNEKPQGYFEITDEEEWHPFKAFEVVPNINLDDPNARLLDLNGDGKTDVLLTENDVFTWYQSDGKRGFKESHRTPKNQDEEEGPHVIFADDTQSIFLADMTGDGLVDIVRIRNGEVCYWPNKGYGKFGTKVGMDHAPVFDSDAGFDPAYIKLADIDGSGTPDLIYLGKNKFTCWMNLSGNAYSALAFEIEGFPSVHKIADITVTDLLGNGLACIVWSSPLQKDAASPLRYIDLMNSRKPHIMVAYKNNLGKEVEMQYTPSTHFYIQDKLAGTPWATKLHFPVYCITKVITADKVTGHIFTSNYTYHHGYYDHAEKEFRGFGRVDQTDTETAENWQSPDGTNLTNADVNQAPVLTRSWFHTGAFLKEEAILDQFEDEYWHKEMTGQGYVTVNHEYTLPPARIIPDLPVNSTYITNISPVELREALRACKSMPLRTEVFAKEGSPQLQLTPYSVGTHNCMVEMVQPKGKNKHAVYTVKESEAITYSYERNVNDPRIAHTLNLALDPYGNVLQTASVVYPRQVPDTSLPLRTQAAQAKTAILIIDNRYTNDAIGTDYYRLRLPYETRTLEITGLTKSGSIYKLSDFANVLSNAVPVPYAQLIPGNGLKQRLTEHIKSLFYKNDLSGPLADGVLESLAIPYENYQLAYTNNAAGDNLVTDIYAGLANNAELNAGNYKQIGTDWWIGSGRIIYISGAETAASARSRFYTPVAFIDPYGSQTSVAYDTSYYLFIRQTTNAVGNTNTVFSFNYRTLSPARMKDANDNISGVLMDELGLPKAMALYGKGTQADNLAGLTEEMLLTEQVNIDAYFIESQKDVTDSTLLETLANTLLQKATARFVYDFDCYKKSGGVKPAVVSTILREEHYAINPLSPVQLSFEYSGGLEKVVMKKVQAEPGEAKKVTDNGNGTISVHVINTTPKLRWIGNGRTLLNNKGNVIKQYEPYFSVSAKFESVKELVEQGFSPIMHYDAMGRMVRTDYPDGTFSKVVFDSWKQLVYDQNDTSRDSSWYTEKNTFAPGTPEKDSAVKAAAHYDTPKQLYFDTLGRPVLTIEQDVINAQAETHLVLDIENNLREVIDARGNSVMQYKYDILGHMVYQNSMDSGQRWLLHTCTGEPLRTWDERNHKILFDYDAIRRPLTVMVKGGDGAAPLNNIVELYEYGEGQPNDVQNNLRGNLYRHYDTGGLEETPYYDLKNNALENTRWLALDYKNTVDWATVSGKLESNSFTITTYFDALNRIKEQTAPDNSIITPAYNARGLLTAETVTQGAITIHLTEIRYDAKEQREYVKYGNDIFTKYTYEEKTFRLSRLLTSGPSGVLQDLRYTYDAVGNITQKRDDNVPVLFYNNAVISNTSSYTYDAMYRLIEATGREKLAPATFGPPDNWDNAPFMTQHHPNDNMAMQGYTQFYTYDPVGNIVELKHKASTGSYKRYYNYDNNTNRLLSTSVRSDTYIYTYHPQHGFITSMPHLPLLSWNFKEEIAATSRQSVNTGTPETTYYQYDSQGTRLRKITENYAATGNTPSQKNTRIYIAGYEFYEDYTTGDQTHTLSLIDQGNRFVMIENSSQYGLLTRYQHPNHQGSVTLETNENGDLITYEEYHPFGTTAYQATNATITATAKRYRYTGMERDEETGLSYHNARYYISWLGRWMNPDPIGIEDGLNVYAYCGNNPVGNTDTSGTQTDELRAVGTGNNSIGAQQQQQALNGGTLSEIIVTPSIPGASNLSTVPTLNANSGVPNKGSKKVTKSNDTSNQNASMKSLSAVSTGNANRQVPLLQAQNKTTILSQTESLSAVPTGNANRELPLLHNKTTIMTQVKIGNFPGTTTVENNTRSTIWLKPEYNKLGPVSLAPGKTTTMRIDGLTHPNYPGQVFKVATGVDVIFGVKANSWNVFVNDGIGMELNQILGGGWIDQSWLKVQHDNKDFGWDSIFHKSIKP